MGRPRKQPRRVVTFNLNVPLADEIDNLAVKNRSEWANRVLKDVLDGRQALRDQNFADKMESERQTGREEAINDLIADPRRLLAMLLNSVNFNDYRTKGRYDLEDHLRYAIMDESGPFGREWSVKI